MSGHSDDIDSLQQVWKELYAQTLPKLARAKDSAQQKWPVTLDHCFARIILDNTIGQGRRQWDQVISKPAIKNMTETQLKAAIELGEKIKDGQVDLVQLDRQSLEARGKGQTKYKVEDSPGAGMKRKSASSTNDASESVKKRKSDPNRQMTLTFSNDTSGKKQRSDLERSLDVTSSLTPEDMRQTLNRIDQSDITIFRKRLYTSLLSVPLGQYTTYAALAEHLGSAARAVGNGMRNNPFAPDVPCHRVLASDGTLGGFFGQWERDKKGPKGYAPKQQEKVSLLKTEGVNFDSVGKVKGQVWKGFWDRKEFDEYLNNQS